MDTLYTPVGSEFSVHRENLCSPPLGGPAVLTEAVTCGTLLGDLCNSTVIRAAPRADVMSRSESL